MLTQDFSQPTYYLPLGRQRTGPVGGEEGGAQPQVAAAAAPFKAAPAATFPAPSEQRGFTRRGRVGAAAERVSFRETRWSLFTPPLVFNLHFAVTLESTSAGGGLKLSERPTVGQEMGPRYTSGSLDFWIQLANKNNHDRKKAPHSFCEISGNLRKEVELGNSGSFPSWEMSMGQEYNGITGDLQELTG